MHNWWLLPKFFYVTYSASFNIGMILHLQLPSVIPSINFALFVKPKKKPISRTMTENWFGMNSPRYKLHNGLHCFFQDQWLMVAKIGYVANSCLAPNAIIPCRHVTFNTPTHPQDVSFNLQVLHWADSSWHLFTPIPSHCQFHPPPTTSNSPMPCEPPPTNCNLVTSLRYEYKL